MLPRVLLALALVVSSVAAAGENLLPHARFAAVDDQGAPVGWRVGETGQRVAIDREEHPANVAQSLRVGIRATHRHYGEIAQKLASLKPHTVHVLRGAVRSSAPRLGFLMVKLYKEGREVRRTSSERSGTEWGTLEKQFETGDADRVEVLCRYLQSREAVGQTIWFADLRLAEAPPPRLVEAEAVATFHSLGLRVSYRGGIGPGTACLVRYRKAGSALWRRGMDLVLYRPDREFRGSLFHLEPDTAYEAECRLSGPSTDPRNRLLATARTWREDVSVAETRTLPAGVSTKPLVIRDKGRPDAWIRYAPPPGEATTIDAGTAADHAVLVEDAAYVIFGRVTVRGGRRDCIHVRRSHHVRIRCCDVAGWGDAGIRKEGLKSGLYVDARGRVINMQAGVRVSDGSRQVVVEHNFIHDPRGTANSWGYGHPAGPQGVILGRTGGNNVVRYNDLIGSETHWWNDAIESYPNRDVVGGPHRDADIYGNVLAFCNDDGVELDGGQINVRFWHNWIDKALCGVSCAPNRRGPSYVFRNLMVLTGEERGVTGAGFKMGGDRYPDPGLSLLLHNTVYTTGQGLTSGHYGTGPTPMVTRNNLFFGPTPGRGRIRYRHKRGGDFDYDLLPPHGVYGVSPLPKAWEAHGVVGRPAVRDEGARDFRLAPGSPGIDAGQRLPGMSDDYSARAPDLGAFERGRDPSPLFPQRPSGLSALPLRLAVIRRGEARAEGAVRLLVPPSAGSRWTAHPNAPWLRCSPGAGQAGDAPQQVRLAPAGADLAPRLHRGAVTFRTDKGYSRTVMVDVKVYPQPLIHLAQEAEAGKVAGGMAIVADGSASGGRYVHTPEIIERTQDGEERRGADVGSVTCRFTVPSDGDYYLLARCMVPGPPELAGRARLLLLRRRRRGEAPLRPLRPGPWRLAVGARQLAREEGVPAPPAPEQRRPHPTHRLARGARPPRSHCPHHQSLCRSSARAGVSLTTTRVRRRGLDGREALLHVGLHEEARRRREPHLPPPAVLHEHARLRIMSPRRPGAGRPRGEDVA